MNTVSKIMGVIVTILIGIIVFFMGIDLKKEKEPNNLYQVYLNGEKIGLIEDKEKLLNLIDKEQIAIKKKYNVDKVYPPNGLDIQSIVTYEDDIISINKVYEKIKDKEPFTVSGYKVTITYKPEESEEEEGKEIIKDPITLNVLRKEDFEDGFYNTIAAFIGSEDLDRYKNGTQLEIVETGSKIENVYWQEDIKIKEDFLSVEDHIYINSNDISKYLLFGTLEEGKKYTVKFGDNIASVAEANNLNVDEFLVANPNFTSANVLLSAGQVVNTALIDPLVNIVYETEKIEDVEVPFETEYQEDDTKYVGTKETIQQGQNGETRVTEKIQYINGEIQGLVITNKTELIPAVNKIVKKGTKKYASTGGYEYFDTDFSNDSWAWPTITPYVITSRYGWRWGELHKGIDISGCGHGSPIYSVGNGVVVEAGYHYSMGNYVYIAHGNNYYTIYMHMAKDIVSVGQTVSRGQQIGTMGNTGRSTGTHLHLGFTIGYPYTGGKFVNPCGSLFSC
ncbi:MAG: peptidoglycan DD-metalloendopeptidase family protein [Bacilli bacterium]|nr:peptidoglycan DD-metalloendopeptidase family protein [Bacilli bacterium]